MKYELKNLKKVISNVSKLNDDINRPSVTMTPGFISSCSQYSSLDDLIKASGFDTGLKDEVDVTLNQEWEQFIQKNTSYEGWAEMRRAAAISYSKANIKKGLK